MEKINLKDSSNTPTLCSSSASIDLLSEDQDFGLITAKVVVNAYFNNYLRFLLEQLGYKLQVIAGQYTAIHNGKCFGVHRKLFDNPFAVKNKVKINNNVGIIIKSRFPSVVVAFEDGTKVEYAMSNPIIEVVENSFQLPLQSIIHRMDKLMRKHLTPTYYKHPRTYHNLYESIGIPHNPS